MTTSDFQIEPKTMEEVFSIKHRTHYRYRKPVIFGEHRLMMRPHDSHDIRLLDASLAIRPAAIIRYYHDQFHNSIAIAQSRPPLPTSTRSRRGLNPRRRLLRQVPGVAATTPFS